MCSPTAARSRWVNEEVRRFKELGRDTRIMCLVVAGEPRAADKGLPPEQECLPPALRFIVENGVVTDRAAPEPLAADLRPGADTRRDAKLKIIAGLLGTGLDELRQRDQLRRQRQLAAIGAASTIGCVAFAGLAFSAFLQRNEAERQRTLAEQKTLTAERTADFMISLFRVSDPSEARGNAVTAREILDRGARQIDQSLREEPQVRADLSSPSARSTQGWACTTPRTACSRRPAASPAQTPNARLRQTIALAELEFQRGNDARADELLARRRETRAGQPHANRLAGPAREDPARSWRRRRVSSNATRIAQRYFREGAARRRSSMGSATSRRARSRASRLRRSTAATWSWPSARTRTRLPCAFATPEKRTRKSRSR